MFPKRFHLNVDFKVKYYNLYNIIERMGKFALLTVNYLVPKVSSLSNGKRPGKHLGTRVNSYHHYHYRAKLLRADWLRERAFFVNQGHFWKSKIKK